MRAPVPITDRYRACAREDGRYAVEDQHSKTEIDFYRSRAVAESYARALNAGAAKVAPHAIIGCRIQGVVCPHCGGRGCELCRRSR